MPPKAKSSGASKKAEQKKKEKIIEDKTFGLKNKKGAKQQKFIQQIQNQVKHGGNPALRKAEEQKKSEKAKKEEKKKELRELNELFKPVQKIDRGVDPKSVLCALFKQGTCVKGDKCKFSHDLAIALKAEKRSIYVDTRYEADDDEENPDGNSQIFNKPHLNMVCKHFLEAVTTKKFGWFWECPNGDKCIYRHAVPAGFEVEKKKEEKKEEISIEDLVEKERANLPSAVTKVTLETFLAWKKKKLAERKAALKKSDDKKKAEFKAGRNSGISGREMFTYRPEMAVDDQIEADEVAFDTSGIEREDAEEADFKDAPEVTLESVASIAQEADNSGTVSSAKKEKSEVVEGAVGGSDFLNGEAPPVPIDENLFMDDDLDGLDEELDDLELRQ